MAATKTKLNPADRARLRELYAQRRYVNSANWYHPAAWYGADALAVEQLRTDERTRLDTAIKALTTSPAAPVQPTLF